MPRTTTASTESQSSAPTASPSPWSAGWELIEPLDEDGIYARFLAEKGEGVHHVAVATPDFDETVARAERKDGLMLSCKHSGVDIAYLDTLRDLGVVLEVFSGFPDDEAL